MHKMTAEETNEILASNWEDKIYLHGIAKDLCKIAYSQKFAECSQEFTDYKPQARLTPVEGELEDRLYKRN